MYKKTYAYLSFRKEKAMKKLICLCMASAALLACLTACGNSNPDQETTASDIKVIDFDTTRAEETTAQINTKKNYKITIPEDLISVEHDGDVNSYASLYGYEVVENEDGKVTLKMDGKEYSMLLSRTGMSTIRELAAIVDSKDFPYAKEIKDYSKDFSYILITVNGKKFSKAENKDFFLTLISQCGLYYQYHANPESPSCQVVIADSESGKVLTNEIYRN